MMTTNRRSEGAWRIEHGQVQGADRALAARLATTLIRHEQVNRWRLAARVLVIVVGLLSGGHSFAGEVLILTGGLPRVTFEDTTEPQHFWDIFVNDAGFNVSNNFFGAGVPFRIKPTAQTSSLVIGTNGRIGFGTSNPQSHLHVQTSDFSPTLRLESAFPGFERTWDLETSAFGVVLRDVNNLGSTPFGVEAGAPTSMMYLAATGSVGLGIASPSLINGVSPGGVSRHLNLNAVTGTARGIVQGQSGAESYLVHVAGTANQRVARTRVSNGKYYISALRDNLVSFNEGFAFTVDLSNGNVGIKTQSPVFPLQVGDSGQADGNGARCTTGGVWTSASSRSVKQDIEPITREQARDTVRALTPVGYRYKNELDEHYIGFIAEDVPELVATKDRKSLASMDITAVLTKVVQDQDRQLDEQRQALAQQQKLITQQQESLASQQATMAALAKRLTDLEEKMSGTGAASR